MTPQRSVSLDILLGVATGDALGVPVEFVSRETLKKSPVTDMQGYGTHRQPPGTWSDDTSLTFCLAETLCEGYDLKILARHFVLWKEYGSWTPYGEVFDIGIATSAAIHSLYKGTAPTLAGGRSEDSNGNGSLMRILPLVVYLQNKPVEQRFEITRDVSSLTHAHIRSVIACFIYLEMALQLLAGKDKKAAFEGMRSIVNPFLHDNPVCSQKEIDQFHRLLVNPIEPYEIKPIYECEEEEINSSGYVLSTLEASFWCLLTTDNYRDAVLKAVNLGSDTDTTGAVTGGLAGLLYGHAQIPEHWIGKLARIADIRKLAEKLERKFG